MNPYSFGECVFQGTKRFISDLCNQFPKWIDLEELQSTAWLAYWEAVTTYHRYAGCCELESFLSLRIEESLDNFRQQCSNCYSGESKLSLDQSLNDSNETVGSLFFPMQGDFTNGCALWDYAERLGPVKYAIIRKMVNRDTDCEIMGDMNMPPERFYQLKYELQADMREYLLI